MKITVTPYVGVWIETSTRRKAYHGKSSHPTWVCGLKHTMQMREMLYVPSHPTWVCGLKHD